MRFDRLSYRLRGYDYRNPDPYYVTICTYFRECLFGEIRNDRMFLNDSGKIVQSCWDEMPQHFSNVVLDAFVVMPNHVHAVIWIVDRRLNIPPSVGMTHASSLLERVAHARATNVRAMPARGPLSGSLGAMVGSFKSAVTRRINLLRGTPGTPIWQDNYHDRIIRTDASLQRIRRYIAMNPARWWKDRLNPSR